MLNEEVVHSKWGVGIITKVEDDTITVHFDDAGDKKLAAQVVFDRGILKFVDPDTQKAYFAEVEAKKKALADRKAAEEKAQELAEKEQTKAATGNFDSRKTPEITRKGNERLYFYVFQGTSYEVEKTGGYIWAPIENELGQSMHHWDRMLDVRPGDIVLHGVDGSVAAISIVKGKAYPAQRPLSHGDDQWIQYGRKVDLEYHLLRRPLPTKDFSDDIKRFSTEKYSPFNVNGSGNMGYLFNINAELVTIFAEWLKKYDPQISDIDGIKELIE